MEAWLSAVRRGKLRKPRRMTRSRGRLSAGHSRADDFFWRVRAVPQQADYGSVRLNAANAEVAADQGDVDRLNA